jgi:hypothetical protein
VNTTYLRTAGIERARPCETRRDSDAATDSCRRSETTRDMRSLNGYDRRQLSL